MLSEKYTEVKEQLISLIVILYAIKWYTKTGKHCWEQLINAELSFIDSPWRTFNHPSSALTFSRHLITI